MTPKSPSKTFQCPKCWMEKHYSGYPRDLVKTEIAVSAEFLKRGENSTDPEWLARVFKILGEKLRTEESQNAPSAG